MAIVSVRTLEISGGARERGRQYGEAAAAQIAHSISFYESFFGDLLGYSWGTMCDRAMRWDRICAEAAPELMDELRGVAEGSGRTLGELLLLNLRGEVTYDRNFDGLTHPAVDELPDGCTSFAALPSATGNSHTYVGQNWDWRTGVGPTLLVLRIVQDPDPTVIMQVEAGQIGRHGANSAGISLNANGLGGRFDDSFGLPQTFLRRLTLNQHRFGDALQVQVGRRAHIASNTLLAHAGGVAIDLETTPGSVGWLEPTDGLLVHGNHYQSTVPPQLAGSYRMANPDSVYRVSRVREGLQGLRAAATSEDAVEWTHSTMSDHFGYPDSVCNHPDDRAPESSRYGTVLSSCVDLTTGDYYVAPSTPCVSEYQLLPWNVFDGPSELDPHTAAPRMPASVR